MCKTGINTVYVCLFFYAVLGVFNSAAHTPAHGLLRHSLSLRLRFILENASWLSLYICACTHFTKLLTRDFFTGPCHQWRRQPKCFLGGRNLKVGQNVWL